MAERPMLEGHSESVLYVNDAPARRTDGGGYVYDAERQHVVAVSYVRPDGRMTRVSFDPMTGEPSIQHYSEPVRDV